MSIDADLVQIPCEAELPSCFLLSKYSVAHVGYGTAGVRV